MAMSEGMVARTDQRVECDVGGFTVGVADTRLASGHHRREQRPTSGRWSRTLNHAPHACYALAWLEQLSTANLRINNTSVGLGTASVRRCERTRTTPSTWTSRTAAHPPTTGEPTSDGRADASAASTRSAAASPSTTQKVPASRTPLSASARDSHVPPICQHRLRARAMRPDLDIGAPADRRASLTPAALDQCVHLTPEREVAVVDQHHTGQHEPGRERGRLSSVQPSGDDDRSGAPDRSLGEVVLVMTRYEAFFSPCVRRRCEFIA